MPCRCPATHACRLSLWLGAALGVFATSSSPALAARATEHRGIVFVSLADLLESDALNGRWELTELGRTIDVRLADRRVRFEEGGDRVVNEGGEGTMLRSPVLVLDGAHYVPAEECAPLMGLTYERKPAPALVQGGRRIALEVQPLDLPHFKTRVEDLRPVRRSVVLTAPLAVRRDLHDSTAAEELPAGT